MTIDQNTLLALYVEEANRRLKYETNKKNQRYRYQK